MDPFSITATSPHAASANCTQQTSNLRTCMYHSASQSYVSSGLHLDTESWIISTFPSMEQTVSRIKTSLRHQNTLSTIKHLLKCPSSSWLLAAGCWPPAVLTVPARRLLGLSGPRSLRREPSNVAPWRPTQSLIDEQPGSFSPLHCRLSNSGEHFPHLVIRKCYSNRCSTPRTRSE